MNKRVVYISFLTIFLLLLVTATVNKDSGKWEPANRVRVSIGSFSGDLSEAISSHNNDLRSLSLTQEAAITDGRSHKFDEVYVSVNGAGMTLRKAIQNTDLCGILDKTINYSNAPDPVHLGTEIEVAPGESLQDAINDGTLVSVDGKWRDGAINTTDATITKYCDNPSPFCGGAGCPGDIGNDGVEIFPYEINLTGSYHTSIDCVNAGGEIYTDYQNSGQNCPPGYYCPFGGPIQPIGGLNTFQGNVLCKFPRSTCPTDNSDKPDWQAYGSPAITETQAHTCYYPFAACRYDCTTGFHPFSETSIETCTYYGGGVTCHWNGCRCRTPSELTPTTCYAPVRAIGCY